MPLAEVFARLDLRRTGTTAIDVNRLLARLAEPRPEGLTTLQAVSRALSGVVAAAIALADPSRSSSAGRGAAIRE